jgi:hypothetical protein
MLHRLEWNFYLKQAAAYIKTTELQAENTRLAGVTVRILSNENTNTTIDSYTNRMEGITKSYSAAEEKLGWDPSSIYSFLADIPQTNILNNNLAGISALLN